MSVPALWGSFQHSDDGYHIGLHEFAHLLAYEQGRNVGIPRGLRTTEMREWATIQDRELKKLRRGRSVVDLKWGIPEQFFPSAVEAFFEKPIALKRMHRRLYGFLSKYFGQDPASWESVLATADTPPGNVPVIG